jgi:other hect domain ubiquitin protein ligase E3
MSSSLACEESAVTDEDTYTSLIEVCTALIISEGTDDPPIHRALDLLHGLLHCEHLSGDSTVLSVRAIRILLEKYMPFLKSKSRVKLVECVRAALKRMKLVSSDASHTAFTFVHTKLWELQEELLQCMESAAQSDRQMRAALPPPEDQLSFCVYVMDVSLDMCLRALRVCCVLLRSGGVSGPDSPVALRISDVFREKLVSLTSMEVNQDWLRLLRHLTEGTVTMWAYVSQKQTRAQPPPPPSQRDRSGKLRNSRKRHRSASSTSTTQSSATDVHTLQNQHVGEAARHATDVATWLRLCQKVCATPRLNRAFRSTVFGCASTVLAHEPAVAFTPADVCVAVVMDLAKELSRNVHTTLTITNPFLNRDGTSGAAATAATSPSAHRNGPAMFADPDDDEDEDQGEDLLSNGEGVKWHTPEPEWPLLVLIAVLLSTATMPSAEYMWWWVGDDDYARRFAKEDRAALTRAFFANEDTVELQKRCSRVHLPTMREIQLPFANTCRVVFQPVPCTYEVTPTCTVPSLQTLSVNRAQELAAALQRCDVRRLFEYLSAVTRYDGAIAQYGQTLLLHVLLITGPDATDMTRFVLRGFLAGVSTALIEKVSEAFLRHDRKWAAVLVEVGVTETILQRSTSATPERSPVMQMLRREAASPPVTPPLLPRTPAALAADPTRLTRILQHGSREEVRELLFSLTNRGVSLWNTTVCVDAVTALATAAAPAPVHTENCSGPVAWVEQVKHVLSGVVVQHLQDITLQYQAAKSLKETVEEAETAQLELCTAGLSPAFCCPQRHPLHHHHSTNWVCDKCGARDLDNAWSCRLCDYDLCAKCARATCNRAEGAVTATALDVLSKVRTDFVQPAPHIQPQENAAARAAAPSASNMLELFTEDGGLISAATPLACLHQRSVHVAELCKSCACGAVCPGPVKASVTRADAEALIGQVDLLHALLQHFGSACGDDVAVQRSLLKAYESVGAFVFLGGVRAIPPALRRVTHGLSPHLPLTVKHLVARYLAVDCRRFAFQVLHDQSAVVMSMVTGVTAESTRNHRIQVPREDMAAMLRILYDHFRALLSPVLRVDFIFEGEEGFGSGPSQELYTELSAHFRSEKKFWFVTEDDGGADPVTLPFPSASALFLQEFFVLGAACARAFVDDFRMNLDLLPESWNLLRLPSLGVPLARDAHEHMTLSAPACEALEKLLEVLDPSLHRTFTQLRTTAEAELAAMELEMEDGTHITTHVQLNRHITLTILTRYEIALENLRQFQWGLLSVMELPSVDWLGNCELSAVLCGAEKDVEGPLFTEDELRAHVTVGNGYSSDSLHVEMFVSIVGGELTRAQQHDFLEFLTGSPRLPLNGLAGLGRPITVAMKDMESKKELTLPSCNTCFLYLKLPPYSTRDIMKERLLFAITEGRRNYSLS